MAIDGRVESIGGGMVTGWAWDSDRPEDRVAVTVTVDGVVVGEGRADAEAPGLAERGIGDGQYGFAVELALADVEPHEAVVHAGDPPVQLGAIPELREQLRAAASDALGERELAPTVDGRVESVANGAIVGWAWSSRHPEVRVRVRAVVDGQPVAVGRADVQAPGLAEIGVGDGRHAFTLELPASLADGGDHTLVVEVAGRRLRFVSDAIREGEGPWAETTFAPGATDAPVPAAPPPDDPVRAADSPATVVVQGRQGWLFGLTPAEASRLTGNEPPDDAAVVDVVARLDETSAALHALGIRHVVAIVPSKLVVHGALAPPGLVPADGERMAAAVTRLAHERQHLDVIDLLVPLHHAAEGGAVFHPREDALTAYGAFVAHRAVLKHAGLAPQGLLPVPTVEGRLARSPVRPQATLETLPAMAYTGDELRPAVLDRQLLRGLEPDDVDAAALHALRMPAEGHLEIDGLPAPRVYQRDDLGEVPRILMLGHPIMHPLTPWLAETTSRLVVLSTAEAPLVQIELEMPALVLQVLDERLLAPASSEHVVERVADQPLDSLVATAAAGPVVEDERQGEGAAGEDPRP